MNTFYTIVGVIAVAIIVIGLPTLLLFGPPNPP